MSEQSSGRKSMVGWPFWRIVLLSPWWMLRYQPLGGIGAVTPEITRVSSTMFPSLLATRSIIMYCTPPWLAQLPRWMWAAWFPGVRPLASTVTVRVCAPGSYAMVALPSGVPKLVPSGLTSTALSVNDDPLTSPLSQEVSAMTSFETLSPWVPLRITRRLPSGMVPVYLLSRVASPWPAPLAVSVPNWASGPEPLDPSSSTVWEELGVSPNVAS